MEPRVSSSSSTTLSDRRLFTILPTNGVQRRCADPHMLKKPCHSCSALILVACCFSPPLSSPAPASLIQFQHPPAEAFTNAPCARCVSSRLRRRFLLKRTPGLPSGSSTGLLALAADPAALPDPAFDTDKDTGVDAGGILKHHPPRQPLLSRLPSPPPSPPIALRSETSRPTSHACGFHRSARVLQSAPLPVLDVTLPSLVSTRLSALPALPLPVPCPPPARTSPRHARSAGLTRSPSGERRQIAGADSPAIPVGCRGCTTSCARQERQGLIEAASLHGSLLSCPLLPLHTTIQSRENDNTPPTSPHNAHTLISAHRSSLDSAP
jgi:hypothetical protein